MHCSASRVARRSQWAPPITFLPVHRKITKHRNRPKVVIDGERMDVISTPCSDLFVVLHRAPRHAVPKDQSAATLIPRLAKALCKAGIRRDSVFRSSCGRVVYAYSMDPANPEQLVREEVEGECTFGRIVNGRLRPNRSVA
jgi:hypothetical protein